MVIDRIVAATVIAAAMALAADQLPAEKQAALTPPAAIALSSTPLPLNRDDPGMTAVGALRFLGAVHLRSTHPDFGGISGLAIGPGNSLLAVTDAGNWLSFDTVEAGGRLTGVTNGRIAAIATDDGRASRRKSDGDAESLAFDPATGAASVVYEQLHRIEHFTGIAPDTLSSPPARTEHLTAMTGWPPNGGGEAMALLPGGRIIISEERRRPDGSHEALLTIGGVTQTIGVDSVAEHRPTDAIALDATRLLVLNRRFNFRGQGAVLTLVDLAPALARPDGQHLPATVLAQWEAPLTLDNMEGLALRRDGGRVFLYIVSDDNFSSLQRTLLMKFELDLNALSSPRR